MNISAEIEIVNLINIRNSPQCSHVSAMGYTGAMLYQLSYSFSSRENELNKLTSLPMYGFIAQLVEHRTGIAEVTGSNPVEALIFSGFFFPIA